MKKSQVFLLLIIFVFTACQAAAQETKTTAAVMDLDAKEGVSPGVASMLSDYLRTQLVNTNKFTIVTRENMEQLLKEQSFQMSGCASNECIVQMGQLLGVRKMVAGSIGKIGTTYLLSLKLIDVQSGQIEKAETEECAGCKEEYLISSVRSISQKIVGLPVSEFERISDLPREPERKPAELQSSMDEFSRIQGGTFSIGGKYSGSFGLAVEICAAVTPNFSNEVDIGLLSGYTFYGGFVMPVGASVIFRLDPIVDNRMIPYFGGEFMFMLNNSGLTVWSVMGKGGVEYRLSRNFSVFGGAGAGLMSASIFFSGSPFNVVDFGFVFESGARFYFL